uniref:Protein MON2 homolog n=1 Tax=Brassica campestris TaxID=3711 RepID=M4DVQ9_BRACM
MALVAALEADLRALSAEARRRYPAVKDGAEHAILKGEVLDSSNAKRINNLYVWLGRAHMRELRSSSSASDLSSNEDILRIFLMACGVRNTKLSVIGLSCLQKLISHDAVEPSSLKEILDTLKDHSEMAEENIQLKTLQTILIIFQSRLHPETEENMVLGLSICLRLLDNNRLPSVYNTAAATFRQAVAMIFDQVVSAESLPMLKYGSSSQTARTGSVTGDLSQNINSSESLEKGVISGRSTMRDTLSETGKLGLRLLEDLTASAAGGSAAWLHVTSLPRTFSLELIEFVLSNYMSVFKILIPYEQVLRHQICSLLMTSLRTSSELEGEMVEPYFRRLVLRSVAHIIRLYSSSLITECEVFLNMLVKATFLDLPLWHRILVLEILRGFCVEARTLRILFQNFDMNPKNTNVVESMVKALARVVSSIQETSEESLAAVAGMFSSKAKGIEWILDNDASSAAVLVASEAHAITLAIEGLLGVVFTVATLTDEAVDVGELESPRYEHHPSSDYYTGKTSHICISMVDSLWLTILDAFSLILSRSQGEAIVLEILKGYQAFTQACGVLHAVEPLNSYLASLCKFTIVLPTDAERRSFSSLVQSPMSKRSEIQVDQRDAIVLTPKNVQALRTLFNVAHRLHNVLGPSWVLVLETLAALDRAIHSPHATTQEVATAVPKLTREPSRQYADFSILSSLNSQLFESSALMHVSAVKSLLSALHMLSHQSMTETSGSVSSASSKQIGSISFSVDRMISILVNNLHRVEPLWDQVVGHFLELAEHSNQNLRNMALDALDQSICAVLGSEQFGDATLDVESKSIELKSVECAVLSSLRALYFSAQKSDVRVGSLKILLHVLERCGEKLYYSWPGILEMLRSVADASEKDVVTLGFQSLRVIMSDGLPTLPEDCLHVCIDVTGAYSAQKTDLNISLTAIGLLWTLTDFVAKGLHHGSLMEKESGLNTDDTTPQQTIGEGVEDSNKPDYEARIQVVNHEKLLFLVFSLIQKLVDDERPEVRNSAVRTFFQILGSHGNKLSKRMWEDCLWNYIFPMLDGASHKAATSSKDEWQGKEIGTRGGKAVHMLIHHSRNTAQKQWDETFVLVLGGIARLFRSYFPLLESLPNFWSGWESLLAFVKNSIFNGSKEVSLAAINCLQTAVVSHCVKGNLQLRYLNSVMDVYELVFQKSSSYTGDTASKVKQEILHGLGELYVQSLKMFDDKMYMQLLGIIDLAIKQAIISSETFETEFGHVPPVLRHVLEILPSLGPPEHLSSMWLILLREFLHYLPRVDSPLPNEEGEIEQSTTGHRASSVVSEHKADYSPDKTIPATRITSNMFAEKLIPALVELLLRAPAVEKYILFPEVIQNLRRCMMTRRDNPDGSLWKVAAEGFNRLLVEDVKTCSVGGDTDLKTSKTARIRIWKEIGDVYEIFLVGYCGRALSSNSLPPAALKANETLEMALVDGLGDIILKSSVDAPREVLERLVSTLDRCASRTCSLPIETVELMPAHCSRFSLKCLQKLFSLSSFGSETENWHTTRAEVSRISIITLMERCEFILSRLLIDENNLDNRPIPTARLEEITFALQELDRLTIHPEAASVLPLQPYLKTILREDNRDARAHLLVLFPSLCEIVLSRETRVRELVQVLLRAVATELGLEKVSLSS